MNHIVELVLPWGLLLGRRCRRISGLAQVQIRFVWIHWLVFYDRFVTLCLCVLRACVCLFFVKERVFHGVCCCLVRVPRCWIWYLKSRYMETFTNVDRAFCPRPEKHNRGLTTHRWGWRRLATTL